MTIHKKIYSAAVFCAVLGISSLKAQVVVEIDHKTQRFIGNETEFKRDKYLNIHGYIKANDPELIKFRNDFNLNPTYRGARLLDSPIKKPKNGVFPIIKKKYSGVREVENRITSTAPKDFFYDKKVDYSQVDMTTYMDELTSFVADYYRYQEPNVPKYIEPLNEPMVHAVDFYPEGKQKKRKYISSKVDAINTRVMELHRELGKKIHATPELVNMKIMGYGGAFPEFEAKNFGVWNKRYKKFIDIAGTEVDVFSVHLYDGSGINNKTGRRSGSNVEAILDIIENYSFIKLHKVKPIAISEYGRLVPNQPGFGKKKGVVNYNPITNSQALLSQNNMVMSFIERGDGIEFTIPFTMNKQPATSMYSKSSLWYKGLDKSSDWEYTPRVNFFKLWKDVAGDRVCINSSEIDMQSQAFVNGKQLHVVLNNIKDGPQTVKLNFVEGQKIKNVEIKRLSVYKDKEAVFEDTKQKEAPESVKLNQGETVIITYNFKSAVDFNKKAVSKKYYSDSYLQPILANKSAVFKIKDVSVGQGKAILRLGVSRNHSKTLLPKIVINGKSITIKGDVIRGYDQKNRKQFFGVLEIPIEMKVLKEGTNTIDVQFSDKGGFVTTAILQVQKIETK
ncbi:hypothetical protein [Polaribacter sp. Q13]|uniref:hypothetical protein n=1 Tax=Polaribacter sp. Q13 TaxID=2806551 RepID=UPI00193BF5B6|nr:hypothetical protein [Polaribacter sp. Q13]QVY65976.1 hypothetical protein JOP69_01385 [Polaribacter sp. Q13]